MPRRIAPVALAFLWAIALTLFIAPSAHAENPKPSGNAVAHGFDPETGKRLIPSERCLQCHGNEKEKTEVRDDGTTVNIFVETDKLKESVHGKQRCAECHTTLRTPHRETPEVAVG